MGWRGCRRRCPVTEGDSDYVRVAKVETWGCSIMLAIVVFGLLACKALDVWEASEDARYRAPAQEASQ